jgi:hypothetical protein
LKDEISILYHEIYNKEINSLEDKPDSDKSTLLEETKADIKDAYARGRINTLQTDIWINRLKNKYYNSNFVRTYLLIAAT